MSEAAGRAAELRGLIDEANHAYYVLDQPTVDDAVYDDWMRELEALEEADPALRTPESPTQRVGAPGSGRFPEVRHRGAMLSLANARGAEGWPPGTGAPGGHERRASARARRLRSSPRSTASRSADLRAPLLQGATRGDGVVGEDVTPTCARSGRPPALADRRRWSRRRGRGAREFTCLRAFAGSREARAAAGPPTFANPRNSAAGSRQIDPGNRRGPLSIWTYGGLAGAGAFPQTAALEWLREAGFRVNPDIRVLGDPTRCRPSARPGRRAAARSTDIDGAVVKIDQVDVQDPLASAVRPLGHRVQARATTATTSLNDIRQRGRTGALVPFAVWAVVICGATVKLATLHNQEDIARKDLRIGDRVVVQRAGAAPRW